MEQPIRKRRGEMLLFQVFDPNTTDIEKYQNQNGFTLMFKRSKLVSIGKMARRKNILLHMNLIVTSH